MANQGPERTSVDSESPLVTRPRFEGPGKPADALRGLHCQLEELNSKLDSFSCPLDHCSLHLHW